jgi:hypothetical protein
MMGVRMLPIPKPAIDAVIPPTIDMNNQATALAKIMA